MARSSGVGSMPGTDFAESARIALGEADIPFLPELPDRGPHAAMIGRALGLITDLGADLQPDGWRIGVGQGIDQRRARSLLVQDLDVVEELSEGHDGALKVQVAGPLTLAATVEHPRGDKVLADHGARRELTEAFVIGLRDHVADLTRRFPRADLIVQIDEPSSRAVLDGMVRTASGFRTHRSLDAPEADALLRPVADAVTAAGAIPVVHMCAADVPVALLRGAGFAGISFDLSLARPDDAWAEAFQDAVDLWIGAVPSATPERAPAAGQVGERIARFFGALGYEPESFADRLIVTPACGVAGASAAWARGALALARATAREFSTPQVD